MDVCITPSLNLFWEELRQSYCLSFCLDGTGGGRGQTLTLLHHSTAMMEAEEFWEVFWECIVSCGLCVM